MTFQDPIWDGIYSSFSEVPVTGPGFDGKTWVNNSLKKITELREQVQTNAPLPPVSNYREALLPLLTAQFLQKKRSLKILDFGGGIGFAYFQTIGALTYVNDFEYHIIERDTVCQAGRKYFEGICDNLYFHTSLDEVEGKFDIIHLGSVLQYIENWSELLKKLTAFSPKNLLLTDILAGNNQTFATAQNYSDSKIAAWFLNINELLKVIELLNYQLVYKSSFINTILGKEQFLPMENFEEKYRLNQTCNLLFVPNPQVSIIV